MNLSNIAACQILRSHLNNISPSIGISRKKGIEESLIFLRKWNSLIVSFVLVSERYCLSLFSYYFSLCIRNSSSCFWRSFSTSFFLYSISSIAFLYFNSAWQIRFSKFGQYIHLRFSILLMISFSISTLIPIMFFKTVNYRFFYFCNFTFARHFMTVISAF